MREVSPKHKELIGITVLSWAMLDHSILTMGENSPRDNAGLLYVDGLLVVLKSLKSVLSLERRYRCPLESGRFLGRL